MLAQPETAEAQLIINFIYASSITPLPESPCLPNQRSPAPNSTDSIQGHLTLV